MTTRAETINDHIDHIHARLDCLKGRLAMNAQHDTWPMPREEYERIAERLDGLAVLFRQHIGAFERADQIEAEVKARMAA
jgi:hypothetical protein